jgi:pimeloyl-ACP methyl ester carboxylesterase
VKFDYDLSEGNLVAIPDQLCAGVAFDHPFDSRLFQSPSPIYYFSGSRDPVTPPVHARYHATHQSASRIFVTVPRGGHHALSENLSDCSEEIWLAILNGQPERVRQALSGCAFGRELIVETK